MSVTALSRCLESFLLLRIAWINLRWRLFVGKTVKMLTWANQKVEKLARKQKTVTFCSPLYSSTIRDFDASFECMHLLVKVTAHKGLAPRTINTSLWWRYHGWQQQRGLLTTYVRVDVPRNLLIATPFFYSSPIYNSAENERPLARNAYDLLCVSCVHVLGVRCHSVVGWHFFSSVLWRTCSSLDNRRYIVPSQCDLFFFVVALVEGLLFCRYVGALARWTAAELRLGKEPRLEVRRIVWYNV